MAWVRLEPNTPTHPKVIRVGIAGFGLFVAGLCYANHYLTDGFIPAAALPAVFPGVHGRRIVALSVSLVEAGLWEVAEGGWRIHDFHHYQPSAALARAEQAARHAAKVEAGRLGGIASGVARAKQTAKQNTGSASSNDEAKRSSVSVSVSEQKDLTTLSGSPPDGAALNGKRSQYREAAKEVLAFLNAKTGRSYRPVDTNLRLIEARLKAGATVENCRGVIVRKARVWGTDPKMAEYLRPATLFNATKFEQYLGEREAVDAG